jgi:hypothetical protein
MLIGMHNVQIAEIIALPIADNGRYFYTGTTMSMIVYDSTLTSVKKRYTK